MPTTTIATNVTAAVTLLSIVAFSMLENTKDKDAALANQNASAAVLPAFEMNAVSNDAQHNDQSGISKTIGETLRFLGQSLEGKRVRAHADGDPMAYVRDMLLDKIAREFLVPDDHVSGVRREIQKNIGESEKLGDDDALSMWVSQLQRLKPLGKDFAALDMLASGAFTNAWRMSRVPRHGKGAAMYVAALDGGMVIYRAMSGKITPRQAKIQAAEVGVKATAVGGATGIAVALGANPAGITVMVIGGVTYVIVDYAIKKVRPSYYTNPLTVDELHAMMPSGWHWDDPLKNHRSEFEDRFDDQRRHVVFEDKRRRGSPDS